MTDRAPTLVLLGTHGQHNIGDELLLESFLHRLGPDWSYVVNSYDPAATTARLEDRYRVDCIDTAHDRLALMRHLLRADALVFAGGSIVKELYRTTGRNRYATMLMLLAVVTFARLVARTPIGMFDIGVGPVPTRIGRLLARAVIRQAGFVSVRDPGSLALCRRVGAGDHVRLSTDAVFAQPVPWLTGGRPGTAGAEDGVLRIGLSLNFHTAAPELWEPFLAALARVLESLAERGRIEVHALPMQSEGKTHHDAEILREFADRLPGVPFVHHRPVDHEDVADVVRRCDLVIAERFHALVLAAMLGVPVLPLAYDVKVAELARLLDLEHSAIDITRPIDEARMATSLSALVDDLDGAGERIAAAANRVTVSARSSSALALAWLRERAR